MSEAVVWPSFKRDLVAILRGVKPDEVEAIVGALIEEKFEAIEVPLNSPEPFRSIEIVARAFGEMAFIGAGTVLSTEDCARVADAGGKLMVSPNVDPAVIEMASLRGMVTLPGCFTPTEALLALRSGASALKFFPAGSLGPAGLSAIKAVLPRNAVVGAVGGVSETTFVDYAKIGVRTFGLGSSLYKPGDGADEVQANARRAIEAYDKVFAAG
ncbi:2-dehydro-3-deoxy-6-phosphogalactonate aldolase [Pseudaminobacter salicylatoxidans]|uniref:2-dehydro-3-deoxy-6-phosphogalactonate aldolase n=1 Tax=Pseudaminobacter salicylatoxidans TaxID=93369 RepID=UPI0003730B53|nr:2-dehydro-3-deoxy-6-phosphogalactonate aldolase [Pseudaminobacter salicylatoxidans]